MARTKRPTEHAVYQIKVTLRGSKPPIWRRFQVIRLGIVEAKGMLDTTG